MKRNKNLPVISDLKSRQVYHLQSRNLILGVYDGEGGFIGIRSKFGAEFLDIEFHWDLGEGTVKMVKEIPITVPCDIELSTFSTGLFDFIKTVNVNRF